MSERVLVIGHRGGLSRALRQLEVPFVVWSEKPAQARGAASVHVGPLPSTKKALQKAIPPVIADGPFSHVIAGTEAAVVVAAWARRELGARAAPFTVALRCHDKLEMKRYLSGKAVPMTPFELDDGSLDDDAVIARLGTPVVVKARGRSGGRGISFAHNATELRAMRQRGFLLERYVDAPEASVESFIMDGEVRFLSLTRYVEKGAVNVVPAPLPAAEADAIRALNLRVLKALKVSWGMAHLEVYRTPHGPLFGEVTLRPPGGYIMEAIRLAWGFSAWEALVHVELGRPFTFPDVPRRWAASWIIHPGAGVVRAVSGEDQARSMSAVKKLKVRAVVGQRIEPRQGVGEDVGYALLTAPGESEILEAVDTLKSTLRIELDAL